MIAAVVRELGRTVRSLAGYGWHTGRWWVAAVLALVALISVLALAAKSAVAPTVYVLF